jgi:hypothetical protein
MNRLSLALAGALLIFLLAAAPRPAPAQSEELESGGGGVRLTPRFITDVENRTNLFLTAADAAPETLTTYRPGLLFSAPVQTHALELRGEGSLIRAAEFPEFDSDEYRANAALDFDLFRGFTLSPSARYQRSSNPPLSETDLRHRYRDAQAGLAVGYRFADRWLALVHGAYLERRFETTADEIDNFISSTYGAGLGYRILPKTTLLGQGDYTRIDDFLARFDNRLWRASLGLVWETTAKLSAEVHGGWQDKKFDQAKLGEHGDWLVLGRLRYQPTDFDQVSLAVSRDLLETEFTARENAASGRYYVSTVGDLAYRHAWTAKIKSRVSARYSDLEFSEGRSDRIAGADLGLEYAPRKWLALSAGAGYLQDRSSQDRYNYADRRLLAAVEVIWSSQGVAAWAAER